MSELSNKFNMSIRGQDELDFVSKLLQPAVRPAVDELIIKGTTSGPLIVEFDPTTTCNFSCPECISADLLNSGQINQGRVIELITEFHDAGVKGIIFIGGGEPLAHSSMPQPLIHAYKLGLAIGLTTNGSLVDRYVDVIAECVKWTRFSMDAGTENTFNTFRPSRIKNSFDKVVSNIERLVKIKKGKVGYSFLLLERERGDGQLLTNIHELLVAARLARNIGCDYFEFKPAVDQNHHLIPFSQKTKTILMEQISELRSLATEKFKIIYPKSVEHLLAARSPDQPKSYTSCPSVELRTVVTPKGIYPCPYKRGHEENILGKPDKRFNEFWVSKERLSMTKKINPSTDCPFYCIRHDVNVLLDSISRTYVEGIDLLKYLIEVQSEDDIFI